MPPRVADESEWDDENPDTDNWDDQDDEMTASCPYCRQEIFEDSVRCPHCGEYISEEDAEPEKKPWWIIVGVLLCLVAMLIWIVMQ